MSLTVTESSNTVIFPIAFFLGRTATNEETQRITDKGYVVLEFDNTRDFLVYHPSHWERIDVINPMSIKRNALLYSFQKDEHLLLAPLSDEAKMIVDYVINNLSTVYYFWEIEQVEQVWNNIYASGPTFDEVVDIILS